MSQVKLKAQDAVEQLKRFVSVRLGKKLGIGTLVFDPAGSDLIFLLDIAEKEFGKEAREELLNFLSPYHKARVIKTLQDEATKQKLWIAASDLSRTEDDEEDDVFDIWEGSE